ncbi:hypothetical protein GCM10027084_28870 [Pseudoxanthomonas sangjuensis]|uniref:hypothetical protein n=1 Tax=Pseudoxanthomonas sangjuensis TaxID=1503750 RepID=UPI001390809D|nr:hypothetical protein [Pseudoxanthomonas sangjuensis]
MSRLISGLIFVLIAGCNSSDFPPAAGTPCQEPFVNLVSSGATQEDQAVLREASEDFCAVVAGKEPIHAKFDETAPLPSDGGTKFYIGRKYKLTVLNSLSGFGSFHGTAHGPIITFDESFAAGNTNEISSIRVYPLPK